VPEPERSEWPVRLLYSLPVLAITALPGLARLSRWVVGECVRDKKCCIRRPLQCTSSTLLPVHARPLAVLYRCALLTAPKDVSTTRPAVLIRRDCTPPADGPQASNIIPPVLTHLRVCCGVVWCVRWAGVHVRERSHVGRQYRNTDIPVCLRQKSVGITMKHGGLLWSLLSRAFRVF
jgi:hypothetical protein